MNQNSQNKETIEDKIKVYDIKKANENMNNGFKNEEVNQASKKKIFKLNLMIIII